MTASAQPFVADFERIAASLPGAAESRLAVLREDALQRFAQAGIPTRRDEEWKYTSMAPLERAAFPAAPAYTPLAATDDLDPLSFGDFGGARIVFVNGRFAAALSNVSELPAGAAFAPLAQALERAPQSIERYLAEVRAQTVFGSLNTAFAADGLYLHLAKRTVVEAPIHVLYISTGEGQASYPRNVIVAESGARATVIEHYAGTAASAAYFTNAVTQVFAAEDAGIEHYRLQLESPHAIHVGGVHVAQEKASRFHSHSIALGAALARIDITTAFEGEGCEATLDGLYLTAGRQHIDHHTLIDHARPRGTSREHYRGVLDGESRGVFNGKVIVQPGAQRTDARQVNHNLLLSRGAEVDTKPQLEIYADDVKCSHGATVGQLDAAQLFYLRSRGIDESSARALLTHAFARDVVERIRIPALRSRLEALLFARLPGARLLEAAS